MPFHSRSAVSQSPFVVVVVVVAVVVVVVVVVVEVVVVVVVVDVRPCSRVEAPSHRSLTSKCAKPLCSLAVSFTAHWDRRNSIAPSLQPTVAKRIVGFRCGVHSSRILLLVPSTQ